MSGIFTDMNHSSAKKVAEFPCAFSSECLLIAWHVLSRQHYSLQSLGNDTDEGKAQLTTIASEISSINNVLAARNRKAAIALTMREIPKN